MRPAEPAAPRPPQPPTASAVETTHLVLPSDTNALGTAFGGRIMQWMDIAAAVSAGRHCGAPSVTVALDDVHFAHPIRLGDVVIMYACVNFAGRTSMEVGVRVEREDPMTRARQHCLSGYFTFVAVNGSAEPIPVPAIAPHTELAQRRYRAAEARRAHRLSAAKG